MKPKIVKTDDFISSSRIIKKEHVGQFVISTVRLPEAYMFEGGYVLGKYETMIFWEGKLNKSKWLDYQERCDTLKEAHIQHQEAKLWLMLKGDKE